MIEGLGGSVLLCNESDCDWGTGEGLSRTIRGFDELLDSKAVNEDAAFVFEMRIFGEGDTCCWANVRVFA